MLLVIDSGNTNTVIALFKGNRIAAQWRLHTNHHRTADEFALFFKHCLSSEKLNLSDIKAAVIGNVVPQASYDLKRFVKDYCGCTPQVVGEGGYKKGIKVKIDNPRELGADRFINALAAHRLFPGDTIVIDFGTATTFDLVSAKGEYLGGSIAPGVHLSLEALYLAAAKLPNVTIERPEKAVGTNTIDAMQSGIYYGYVGLIEGVVTRMEKEYGKKVKVIATGGLAPLLAKGTKRIAHIEPDLTLHGLYYYHQL